MSAPSFHRVLEYPCRLSYGCTSLTTSWPHGGTGLGFCDEVVVAGSFPVHIVQAEELAGASAIEVVTCGEGWALTCLLRDGDDAAVAQAFPNSAAGATSQHTRIASPGSVRAGYGLSARGVVLVVTPESVVQGNEDHHDMVVFYKALPYVQGALELKHRLGVERSIPLAFWGIPNASGVTCQIGRLRDLTAVA